MIRPKNLKEGDMFRVIGGDDNFNVGDIVTLRIDDGTNCPYFWKEDKSDYHYIYFSNLEPCPKSVRDAQVGDVVVGKSGSEYMVLERGQSTVVLSCSNNFIEARGSYHFDELKKNYTLKAEPIRETTIEDQVKIVETLDGMRKHVTTCCHTPNDSCDSDCASKEDARIYNQTLDEIIEQIKKLAKKE